MIKVNVEKAKEIAHTARRAKRTEEFKPFDVLATVPGMVEEAEKERQAIRTADAEVQLAIDAASTPEEIKEALGVK